MTFFTEKCLFIALIWGVLYLIGAFIGWDAGWVFGVPDWDAPFRVALIPPIGFAVFLPFKAITSKI